MSSKFRVVGICIGSLLLALVLTRALKAPSLAASAQSTDRDTVLAATSTPVASCRFGFGALRSLDRYDASDLGRLRAGLYMNWGASASPSKPNGMEYVQTIRVKQWKWRDGQRVYKDYQADYEVPYTYTLSRRGGTLQAIAQATPGSLWLIGNEIERRDWRTSGGGTGNQDEILPEVYAQAYHEAYTTIKAGDPTAMVGIGGVIQATPLRLEYLDRIWAWYFRLYGEPIPVDYWNVHAFVLQEVSGEWGADIPAGISATEGIRYTVNDNKDWSKAAELIRAFRQWMKEHGLQNKPLIVSEYGVNMPWFSPEEVRDESMYPSFDFFLNEKDTNSGYPADEYRLVQRWIWYSLDDDSGGFSGYLYHSGEYENPVGLSILGQYWEAYVSNPIRTPLYVDLAPIRVWHDPQNLLSASGESMTVTVYVEFSNSGNVAASAPFTLELQDVDGQQVLISETIGGLPGCGSTVEISVTLANLPPGGHEISARVDVGGVIAESIETNNELHAVILVATEKVFVPLVLRSSP